MPMNNPYVFPPPMKGMVPQEEAMSNPYLSPGVGDGAGSWPFSGIGGTGIPPEWMSIFQSPEMMEKLVQELAKVSAMRGDAKNSGAPPNKMRSIPGPIKAKTAHKAANKRDEMMKKIP